ncbi:MAG: hypothetical protein ACK52I_23700 [Pseudomonadota bacterium]
MTEPRELREHEPHPVRALATRADLGEGRRVGVGLRRDEALESVGFVRRRHDWRFRRVRGHAQMTYSAAGCARGYVRR